MHRGPGGHSPKRCRTFPLPPHIRRRTCPPPRPYVRPLDETPYLFLDARYERIREGGQIVDCAVLVAVGVTATGHRRVLGVSVALSEAEVHWRQLLCDLIRRGLRGVKLIVSDDHAGLKAARRVTLPSVPWQRCQFHLQQNAHAYVPRLDFRKEVAQRIRSIFNAPDKAEAQRLLNQAVERWQKEAPKLAEWADASLPSPSLQRNVIIQQLLFVTS